MSEKPSFLGLLNAISLAESSAHCYLTEWAGVTKNPDVRQVLLTVAAREGEHAMSFAKRINELGYEVRQKPDDSDQQKLEIVRSECSDLEKMQALGLGELDSRGKPDVFDDVFKDHSIDIRTGELLGRYIAEERDSGRLLRACYECLCAAASPDHASVADQDGAAAERLAALEAKVDDMSCSVDEIKQLLRARAVPVN